MREDELAMSLASVMIDYLHAGADRAAARPVIDALRASGRRVEARLLSAHVDEGRDHALVEDPHTSLLGRRAWIGPRPPANAAAGDVWLDTCDLSLMVLVAREPLPAWDQPGPPPAHVYPPLLGWLAWRATARWQLRAFMELAELSPREATAAPLAAFDRARWDGDDETAPVAGVTRAEAMAYARFFGKTLADLGDWQAARVMVSSTAMDELWSAGPGREWVAFSLTSEPDRPVAVGPEMLDLDPDAALEAEDDGHAIEPRIIFGPWEHFDDVGFRTAVPAAGGLLLPGRFERVFVGDRRLVAPLVRPA
jgi:hypothetical protein